MPTKRQPYTCIHCGAPVGVTGHLHRFEVARVGIPPLCGVAGTVALTSNGEVRVGFKCPPGHTCLTMQVGLPAGTTMTEPLARSRRWRDHKPTPRQLEFLAVLGYLGPAPLTKGQAHDLLDHILKDGLHAAVEELRVRGIIVRD